MAFRVCFYPVCSPNVFFNVPWIAPTLFAGFFSCDHFYKAARDPSVPDSMKVVLPVVPIGFVRDGSLPLLWILLPRLYIFRLCDNCSKLFGERVNDIVSCMNSPVDNDDFLFV